MTYEEQIGELQKIVDTHQRIVFFGGAGVSTESGIPDFRSQDGLYHQQYAYPPETIISHSFFLQNTEEFYRFYKDKMLILDVEPNPAHRKLAELERAGKLKAVVTQNIDGLHQKAGSRRVYELHGSIHRNHCLCDECGGLVKPDVVLYEEGLDQACVEGAVNAIRDADCLMISGTSLVVYPAAGLIDYFRGDRMVLINKSATSRDRSADLVISAPIGDVLSKIQVR